ncbi:MAG: hypothetical protein AAB019_09370, partial [Planctomycetota bacterium]
DRFNSDKILRELQRNSKEVTLLQEEADTLILKAEGIEISFFAYPYKLIKPVRKTEFLYLAK